MNILFTLKNNEQVLLRSDPTAYELCKIRRDKDKDSGEIIESWESFKYFASLPQALNRIVDMKVRASDATSLKRLASDLESARAEIMAAWSTTFKGDNDGR